MDLSPDISSCLGSYRGQSNRVNSVNISQFHVGLIEIGLAVADY